MKRYLSLYRAFFKFSVMNFTVFRANLINGIVSTVGWGIFQLIWIRLLTIRTQSAFGWSKNELTILALMYVIVIGVFHFLFTRNFDRFSRIIDRGELDFMLLKPVNPQFYATCFIFSLPNLARVFIGSIFLVLFMILTKTTITLAGMAFFLVLSLFGIILLYSLWLSYSTLLIWFPRLTNIIDFLYTINGMARYPVEMLKGLQYFLLFFVLPFALTISTPAKVFLRGGLDQDTVILIVFSLGLFFISNQFFKFALRHYTSASS